MSVKQQHANTKLNSCFKKTNSAEEFTWPKTLVKGYSFHHCKPSVWFSLSWQFLKTSTIWLVFCGQCIKGSRFAIWVEIPYLKCPKCLYVPFVPKVRFRWTTDPWEHFLPGIARQVVDMPIPASSHWAGGLTPQPSPPCVGCHMCRCQVMSRQLGKRFFAVIHTALSIWAPECCPVFSSSKEMLSPESILPLIAISCNKGGLKVKVLVSQ